MRHPPNIDWHQQPSPWAGGTPSAPPPMAGPWFPGPPPVQPPRGGKGPLLVLVFGSVAVMVVVIAVGAVALLLRSNGGSDDETTPSVEASASSGTSSLATVEPCPLLSADDAASLNLTGGMSKRLGKARTCRWDYHKGTDTASYQVWVAIWDSGTPEGLDLTDPQPVTIGKHSGLSGQGGLRTGCAVALLVGPSVIEVELLGGEDDALACDIATRSMTVIEPRLP